MKIVGLLFTGVITTILVIILEIAAITVSAFIGYKIGDQGTRITPWKGAGIAVLSAIATLTGVVFLIVKYLP